MDMEKLIELAVKAVKAYLVSEGIPVESAPAPVQKHWALILTEDHCDNFCSKEKNCGDKCGITCALAENYDVDIDCYDTVVLYDMTNVNLFKLANGCTDSKFLSLAAEAILKGKRVLMVKEDVEILKYENSPAKALYANICKNLDILKDSGVKLVSEDELKGLLNDEEPVATEAKPAQAAVAVTSDAGSVYEITKKVITERDIKEAFQNHATKIKLPEKPLITGLARDTARELHIELV